MRIFILLIGLLLFFENYADVVSIEIVPTSTFPVSKLPNFHNSVGTLIYAKAINKSYYTGKVTIKNLDERYQRSITLVGLPIIGISCNYSIEQECKNGQVLKMRENCSFEFTFNSPNNFTYVRFVLLVNLIYNNKKSFIFSGENWIIFDKFIPGNNSKRPLDNNGINYE